jgi:uncharacterized protein (DUF2147 family)
MKNVLRSLVAIVVSSIVGLGVALADTPTPVGTWQTIDDTTNKPRSIVVISLDSQGQLVGKISKIYYRPGEGPDDVCSNCTGDLRNQKMLGLTILTNMQANPKDPTYWSGGKILDPETGKVYKCHLTVAPDNKTLKVRGYIGVSLIGRTQTWNRM